MKPNQRSPKPAQSLRRSRKPYHSPKLVTYGDVRRLTDAVDFAGMVDGGGTVYGMTLRT